MKYNIKILFFILFILRVINNSSKFSIQLVDENMRNGTYIRPTISEDGYLYIVTGEDRYSNGIKPRRFIISYNIKSATINPQHFSYPNSYGFWRGEPYVVGDNSQYLFISTFSPFDEEIIEYGTLQFINLKNYQITEEERDNTINGYRRTFKKAGSYYYFIHLDNSEQKALFIKKMLLTISNNMPSFVTVKSNRNVKINYQAMISCDFTKDNNYFLCSYFSEKELKVKISVFNTELSEIYSKEYEKVTDFGGADNFIKIVYLKDNSDFILMNSENNQTTRLRYFNYKYNTITDKLSSIIKSSNTYLDIANTQDHAFNGFNDIMAVDSDKIVKVFGNRSGNDITITIIQFYENDSKMTIKIYKMINNNGFNLLDQTRISLLKNSFVICLSGDKDGFKRPGYSFINFPNSTDITLTQRNIVINQLISLENKLYSAQLKFRILSIPKDYIFINKLNSEIKKVNDELELNDELILRQYRVNEGQYILEYEAIARGTDFGYESKINYPTNSIINDNNVLLEGRLGKITIELKDCLVGYYHLENDMNLCTNIKPKGHYIDEKSRTYKACPSICEECNAPIDNTHMNCLTCKPNYYLAEDTLSCYTKDKENYYLDIDDILRRCYYKCLHCSKKATNITFMNCLECPQHYYMTKDTNSCYNEVIDEYYLDNDDILKRCHPNCMRCSTKAENETFMNCLRCKNNFNMTEDTHSCYDYIPDNYFLDTDDMFKRCHPNCSRCSNKTINETFMNCIKCPKNFYMTEDTNSCYDKVIDNYYLDKNNTLKRCHPNCLRCSNKAENETFMNCLKCKENFYITNDTNSCYDYIPDNYYLDKNNTLKRCPPNCLKCSKRSGNDTFITCLKCPNNFYMIEDNSSCYDYIPNHYYLDVNILRKCHHRCLNCFGPYNESTMNCSGCIEPEKYFYRNDTYNCVLQSEFNKTKNIEFSRISNVNFYLFIIIFVCALIILIITCKFYEKGEQEKKEKQEEQKEKYKKLNEKEKEDKEMDDKSDSNSNSNDNSNLIIND